MTQGPELPRDACGPVAAGAVAVCALTAVPGVGPAALGRIAESFGTAEAALAAGAPQIAARARDGRLALRADTIAFLGDAPDLRALGLRAVEAARAAGACVALPGDPSYPELLARTEGRPPVLYVRGTLRPGAPRIALVGARAAGSEGLAIARQLAEDLARAGIEVVSGGARGIDAAAHAGALWGAGATVAVLGSGIDVLYPRENAALFERVAAGGGAIVSEFVPGTASRQANFPRRNRTVSGLSSAVVVVRAAAGSGALITAGCAAKQGRPVFAVPGEAFDPLAAGPNQLIEAGAARPVRSASEVLRHLGWPVPARLGALEQARRAGAEGAMNRAEGVGHRRRSDGDEEGSPATEALDEVSARLLGLLDDRRPLHLDELAKRGEVGAKDALRGLQDLELKGLCVQRPGKYYLRRTP